MEKRTMEDILRRHSHVVKQEEKRNIESGGDEESCREEIVDKVGNKRPYPENDDMKPLTSSKQKNLISTNQVLVVSKAEKSSMDHDSIVSSSTWKEQDDQLESARAKIGEVREENQRLKMYLNRVMNDYQTLQIQFYQFVHDQEAAKKSIDSADNNHQEIEEPDLVSLTLGRVLSGESKKDEKNKAPSQEKEDVQDKEEGLTLGLDCKFEVSKSDATEPLPNPSPENSSEEPKEEAAETWPASKVLKTMRSGDDEVLEQNPVKKARVSVRARCDTPTLNDGCQWRKYGQKIAKGNPCPRAYYRCSVAPSCPVRKQVQRCADDMSILITTYEGIHNHPLHMSAIAMASTTSAAASMLLSGSSSSSHPVGSSNSSLLSATNTTTPANLHGLNFYLSDNLKSKQFYLPTNSSFSSSTSYPVITLDLTTSSTVPSSSSSSPFNRMFSSAGSAYPQAPRYPSTSLNFNTSSSEHNSNSTLSWGSNGFLSHGNTQVPYVKNQYGSASALNLGRQHSMENNPNIFQSFMQKNNNLISAPLQQSLPADTIAAATKAITADPSFQSALAAALTSIIGNGSSSSNGPANQSDGGNLGQKLKLLQSGDQRPFPVASAGYSATSKGNGCASSYLNKSTSTATQQGSLMFLQHPLPFSNSKSASASPGDARDHSN